MRKLTVKNFSVIKDAEIDFKGINVIIGPQSSGKSLLCRITYFCSEIASIAMTGLSDDIELDVLKDQISENFSSWFPIKAWGTGKFEIAYCSGKFSVAFKRTQYGGNVREKFKLTLGQDFSDAYENTLRDIRASSARASSRRAGHPEDRTWHAYEIGEKRLAAFFEDKHLPLQIYVPAGRAFFTNYSKAITAFESGSLDVVTSRFGRMIERIFNDLYSTRRDAKELGLFDEMRKRILKGSILNKRGALSFVTEDGRTLSLAHLSSGTQEALPLLAALRWVLNSNQGRTIFAEEPEVHLFPSAQLELVKLFAWLANIHDAKSCWVITTHSPYILSSFNALIKAGQVATEKPEKVSEVDKIIPKAYWIAPGSFRAYAFDGTDGILRPIMDKETGLIDGDVLDGISATIGQDFEQMLEIQYANK